MIEITVNREHPRSSQPSTSSPTTLAPKEKSTKHPPIISTDVQRSPITNTDENTSSRTMSSSSERGAQGPARALSCSSIDKSESESDVARANPAAHFEMPGLKGAAPAVSPSRDSHVRTGSVDAGAPQTPSRALLAPPDLISSSPGPTVRHVSNSAGTSPTTYF